MTIRDEGWLTIEEAAEFLDLSVDAVRYRLGKGYLKAYHQPGGRRLYFKLAELRQMEPIEPDDDADE